MTGLYGTSHRAFQEENGTSKLADRLEEMAQATFDERAKVFVESVALFFLATVDEEGRPTVSYKGGAPGFVRVTGPSTLTFPIYDGNGMYLSLGNASANPEVGLLFIDFERPNRLRVQGRAEITSDPALLASHPGASYLVSVVASRIFVNCGRYIHRVAGTALSPHVPDAAGRQPFPAWKKLEFFTDVLAAEDSRKVAALGGPVGLDQYAGEAEPAPVDHVNRV